MDEITEKDIQQLINFEDQPCISLYMNTRKDAGKEVEKMRIQYKNLLSKAEKMLKEKWNYDERKTDKILSEAQSLTGERTFWQHQNRGLAVFLGPDFFTYYRIPRSVHEGAYVSRYFNIIDIIPEFQNKDRYYVLALSRKQNQLYQATRDSIELLEIDDLPESIDAVESGVKIEDDPKYRSQSSGGSGQQAVFHGESAGDVDHPEKIRYIKQINNAISKFLQKEQSPLILMCVQDLFGLYRDLNTYPNFIDDFVKGNPDKLQPEEIHAGSWNKMEDFFQEQSRTIIEKYNNLINSEKTSSEIKDIVSAAVFGKIDKLLIKKGAGQPGKYDSEKNEVFLSNELNADCYDLYNFSAIRCLNTGSEIHVLSEEMMPENTEIAALYRF